MNCCDCVPPSNEVIERHARIMYLEKQLERLTYERDAYQAVADNLLKYIAGNNHE